MPQQWQSYFMHNRSWVQVAHNLVVCTTHLAFFHLVPFKSFSCRGSRKTNKATSLDVSSGHNRSGARIHPHGSALNITSKWFTTHDLYRHCIAGKTNRLASKWPLTRDNATTRLQPFRTKNGLEQTFLWPSWPNLLHHNDVINWCNHLR